MAAATDLDAPSPSRRHPLDTPANLLASVGTAWIFVIMCLVVADVIGRGFLNRPITGVAEFSARSVASIVFLQLAAAVCSGRMTRSDFLVNLIGKRSPVTVTVLDVFNALAGAALFGALAFMAWPEFRNSLAAQEFFGVEGIYSVPAWPFRLLIVGGSVAGAVCYLLTIPGILRKKGALGPVEDSLGGGS
jgi:TRAP-type C4-dicarboxylate transport system permease small subunit